MCCLGVKCRQVDNRHSVSQWLVRTTEIVVCIEAIPVLHSSKTVPEVVTHTGSTNFGLLISTDNAGVLETLRLSLESSLYIEGVGHIRRFCLSSVFVVSSTNSYVGLRCLSTFQLETTDKRIGERIGERTCSGENMKKA